MTSEGRAAALDPELRSLLTPRAPLGLPVPDYAGRSLPNVASTIARALGAPASDAALPPLAPGLDPFEGRRAEGPVLLWVIDGLGFEHLRSAARTSEAASRWFHRARPLTSVFPTTTTVALASLATASPPSRHGLVGYRQFLPRYGAVVDMLRFSPFGVAEDDALLGPAWKPTEVLAAPTIYRQGVRAVALSRDRFEGRAFTRAIYDGAEYASYASGADFAGALAGLLTRAEPPPLLAAYWDELDLVEHLRGPGTGVAGLEADRCVGLLDFVARSVGPAVARRTRVLITADHGLVPVEPASQLALDAEPTIAPLLAQPPTGDRRVGFLRARRGAVGPLRAALAGRVPVGTRILAAEEAVDGGLFGPPPYHPELLERLGDLVVLVPSPSGITYALPGRLARRPLVGAHGGLEPAELLVPLVTGTLEELATVPGPG